MLAGQKDQHLMAELYFRYGKPSKAHAVRWMQNRMLLLHMPLHTFHL